MKKCTIFVLKPSHLDFNLTFFLKLKYFEGPIAKKMFKLKLKSTSDLCIQKLRSFPLRTNIKTVAG